MFNVIIQQVSGGIVKKKLIILLILIFSGLLVFGLVTQFNEKKANKEILKKITSSNKKSSVEDDIKLDVQESNTNQSVIADSYFEEEDVNKKSDEESEVVTYVEDVIDTAIYDDEVTDQNESKLKNTFILLTDFIFYDGQIKGHTFSELKNTEKEKIINSWEKLDNYIENKYPNYKETIKNTSKKNYSKIKDKFYDLKEQIRSSFQEKVGDETYNNTIDQFNEDKSNFESTIEPYKEAGKSVVEAAKDKYESTKEKLKDWYKNYKESN